MSTMKIFVLTRQRDPHVRCESLEKNLLVLVYYE